MKARTTVVMMNNSALTPDLVPYGKVVESPNYLLVTLNRRTYATDDPWQPISGPTLARVESQLITALAQDWPDNVRREGAHGFRIDLLPTLRPAELSILAEEAYNAAMASLDRRTDRDMIIRVEGNLSAPGTVFGPTTATTYVITNA